MKPNVNFEHMLILAEKISTKQQWREYQTRSWISFKLVVGFFIEGLYTGLMSFIYLFKYLDNKVKARRLYNILNPKKKKNDKRYVTTTSNK